MVVIFNLQLLDDYTAICESFHGRKNITCIIFLFLMELLINFSQVLIDITKYRSVLLLIEALSISDFGDIASTAVSFTFYFVYIVVK